MTATLGPRTETSVADDEDLYGPVVPVPAEPAEQGVHESGGPRILEDDEFSISSSRGPTPPPQSREPERPLEEAQSAGKTRFLTHEELEYAKSLVLDLLGWGVSPEYLVDAGVSPQIIYKIFTDLHLRLPYNITVIQPSSNSEPQQGHRAVYGYATTEVG